MGAYSHTEAEESNDKNISLETLKIKYHLRFCVLVSGNTKAADPAPPIVLSSQSGVDRGKGDPGAEKKAAGRNPAIFNECKLDWGGGHTCTPMGNRRT